MKKSSYDAAEVTELGDAARVHVQFHFRRSAQRPARNGARFAERHILQ